ncbi:MAG: hypothetical protein AAF517_20040 [Planctomycetota bacterium]
MDISQFSDAELAKEFLERKFLAPEKLKAALDYQGSVGGRLPDVLLKLGLVKEEDLSSFLERLGNGETFIWGEAAPPAPVDFEVDKLRIHKKLLDKVPAELVEKYGILFFFPPTGTRAILMCSEPEVGPKGVGKLQTLLGVEICPITLGPEDRLAVLGGGESANGASSDTIKGEPTVEATFDEDEDLPQPAEEPSAEESSPEQEEPAASEEEPELEPAPEDQPAEPEACEPAPRSPDESLREPSTTFDFLESIDDGSLVHVVTRLLIKKGLITEEDIAVEVAFLKRNVTV